MKRLILLLILFKSGFCGVLLVNDSPFMLIAEVQGANGIMLNQVTIAPGEQTNWTQDLYTTNLSVPADSNVSLTPYRVLWKCAYGGFYSTCTNVSPGSLVRASACSGAHYCKPKDDDQQQEQDQQPQQQLQCPPCDTPQGLTGTN